MKNLYLIFITILLSSGLYSLRGQCVTSDADPICSAMNFTNSCFGVGTTNTLEVDWGISQNPINFATFANVTAPAGAWGLVISLPQTGEYEYVPGSITSIPNAFGVIETTFTWYYDAVDKSLRGYSNSTVVGGGKNGVVQLSVLGLTDNSCNPVVSNAEIFITAPGEDMFFPEAMPCLSFHNNDSGNDNRVTDTGLQITVPVELASFTAESTDCNEAKLDWITVAEINNSHFEILKSYDGKIYQEIARIDGNGTTTEEINYSYVDRSFTAGHSGNIYYSLRQVDYDGQSERFNNLSIRNQCEFGELVMDAYPNPTVQYLNLSLTNYIDPAASATIYINDASGQLVRQEKIAGFNGETKLDLQDIKPGMYLLKLVTTNHIMEKRFIKIK